MIQALLDTNVLLDFLNKRKFHAEASQILDLAASGKMRACVSAHEMTTLAYFLEKEMKNSRECREILKQLFSLVRILAVDKEILENAVYSQMEDFEDAVLEAVCLKNGVQTIVTRNVKDFVQSKVEAVNPSLFLELMTNSLS